LGPHDGAFVVSASLYASSCVHAIPLSPTSLVRRLAGSFSCHSTIGRWQKNVEASAFTKGVYRLDTAAH